jgi:hypothetical protein
MEKNLLDACLVVLKDLEQDFETTANELQSVHNLRSVLAKEHNKMRKQNKIIDFVANVLDEMPKYQMMGMDQQGYTVMMICAEMDVDGFIQGWEHRKNMEKTEMVKSLWKKYRGRV